jgi:hypothetical protein
MIRKKLVIYTVMENNINLRNDPRIILVHRPENAVYLDINILGNI